MSPYKYNGQTQSFLFAVLSTDIRLSGLPDYKPPWVYREQVYNLTCEVGRVKPAVSIWWIIDSSIIGDRKDTVSRKHPDNDGTFILTKSSQHQFTSNQA